MTRLPISLACWSYDRTAALLDGRVRPDGIDLNYQVLDVEETFFRMLRFREFDVAEMSLSSYCVTLANPERPFVALPVFPSRVFRHSNIYVSSASGIERPEDLAGKRVGVPEYQLTAIVWIRGLLQDEFGIDPASVRYLTGGEEQPGREEKIPLNLPARFDVSPIAPDRTLSHLLAEGEIDAIYAPRVPSTAVSRPDRVRRLFPDYVAREKDYFRRTGIFPPMHVVVIRRELYEANRWMAQALYKAFIAARDIAYHEIGIFASLKTMLPWQVAEVEQTVELMGADWWPYGSAGNRAALETFLRYHHEQGLSPRLLQIEEMFAPETSTAFKV